MYQQQGGSVELFIQAYGETIWDASMCLLLEFSNCHIPEFDQVQLPVLDHLVLSWILGEVLGPSGLVAIEILMLYKPLVISVIIPDLKFVIHAF